MSAGGKAGEDAGFERAERVVGDVPEAQSKRSRWPGWIWSVPIAAALVLAWLIVRQLTAQGVLITVVFPRAHGISANQTAVVYQGLSVGKVESVHLEKDLSHVRVTLRIDSELAGHLGKGTEFWIRTPGLTDLTSIHSIIAGPSIGIAPARGGRQKLYQGLAEAPVVAPSLAGTRYTLSARDLGTVVRGSEIYFHGLDVGVVDAVTLEPDRRFRIGIFVRQPYDRLVHENTRFWNAGAVQVSLAGAGPRLQMQSLPALINGAIDFETPAQQGARAPAGHGFVLHQSETAAEYAPGPFSVAYRVIFGPDGGGLSAGAAVTLAGVRVGTVEHARLRYDQVSGALEEHALLALDPSRIALADTAEAPHAGRAGMDALMDRLIARGLRAEVASAIPFVGSETVRLAFVEPTGEKALLPGKPPQIPAAMGQSGVGGILQAVSAITTKLENLPLEQIADNLKTLTGRVAALSTSAGLGKSIRELQEAVGNLKAVSASAETNVPAMLSALRRVANEADSTVASAHQLVDAAAGTGPLGLNTASLGETLYQINRAAESIRALAAYLDRHPSALIRGRR